MKTPNKVFNLTYSGVTVLASATTAPPKTQVKTALDGPFGQRKMKEISVSDILNRIKSAEVQVRNTAAIDFVDYVDTIREELLAAIVKPENINHRGTPVYALQSISCCDYFLPLFKVLLDSGFEVAMSIYQIFEKQHFDLDAREKLEAKSLFEDYLRKLPQSKYDFEDERKARVGDVLEWYCGESDMEHTNRTIAETFQYIPVFASKDGRVICYRVFQDLRTNKFHVQSKDFVSADIDREAQSHRQLIELFLEEAPNSRIKGYDTAVEAISYFDREFDQIGI